MEKMNKILTMFIICIIGGLWIWGISFKDENTEPAINIIQPASHRMDVPLVSQLPELYNGCEITSLTMALNYKNIDIDKITLANEMIKDTTEIVYNSDGGIEVWGNPINGFVGDVTKSSNIGYSIDPTPLIPTIEKYYEEGYINLTGSSLSDIEKTLANNSPIVAWITVNFKDDVEWVTWMDKNNNEIKATFSTHAVTLTGFDENYIYYNDPLTNEKDNRVSKSHFMKVWDMMGRKALALE